MKLFVVLFLAMSFLYGHHHSSGGNSNQMGPGIPEYTYDAKYVHKQTYQVNNPKDTQGRKSGANVTQLYKGYVFSIFGGDGLQTGPRGMDFYKFVSGLDGMPTLELVKRYYSDSTQILGESHQFGFYTQNGKDYGVFHTEEGIVIWDFTDVLNAKLVSRLNIKNITTTSYDNTAFSVFVQWPYAYVAGSNTGLRIVNIKDPENPYVEKTITNTGFSGRLGFCYAVGNILMLSNVNQKGFSFLDISKPANPTKIFSKEAVDSYHVGFRGDRVFELGRNNGKINVYKVGNLESYTPGQSNSSLVPLEKSVSGNISNSEYVYFKDNKIYVGGGEKWFLAEYDSVGQSLKNRSPDMTLLAANANEGHPIPFGNTVHVGDDHGTGSGLYAAERTPDNTKPVVQFSSPSVGSVSRDVRSRIGFVFSDMIQVESVNSANFIVKKKSNNAVVNGVYTVFHNYVNFSPLADLEENTEYTVTLSAGGIKDWSGNGIDSYSYSFTTGSKGIDIDNTPEVVEPLKNLSTNARYSLVSKDEVTLLITPPPTANELFGVDDSVVVIPVEDMKSIEVSTEQAPTYSIDKAFDFKKETFWHSQWMPSIVNPPYTVNIELKKEYDVNGMLWFTRQDNDENQTSNYELYVGMDKNNLTKISEGNYQRRLVLNKVDFETTKVKHLQFKIMNGVHATLSEVAFSYVPEKQDTTEVPEDTTTSSVNKHSLNFRGKYKLYTLQGKEVEGHNLKKNKIYIRKYVNRNVPSEKILYSP